MANLLSLAKKRAGWYIIGISALIVTDIAHSLIPKYLIPAAFDIASGNRQEGTKFHQTLSFYILLMILIAITITAGRFIWRTTMLGSSRKIETDLRSHFFEKILGLPITFFKEFKTGDLMSRATNDLKMIRTATGMAFVALLDSIIMLTITLIMALSSYGLLALSGMAILAFIPVILLGVGGLAMKQFKKVQESYAALTGYVQENLNGIRVIKTLAKEDFALNRFKKYNDDYKKRYRSIIITFGMIFPIITLFIGFSSFAIIRFAGAAMIKDNLTPGNFTALTLFVNQMVWPMIGIGYSATMLMRGRVSINRLTEILEKKSESDIEAPHLSTKVDQLNEYQARLLKNQGKIDIKIKNLNFSYPDQPEVNVLNNITFELHKSKKLGILGKTGSGKSTLINLLSRLNEPSPGEIFFNGIDIYDLPTSIVRKAITYVPQETLLFSHTIKQNIAFGSPNPTLDSDAKIQQAAHLSTIDRDFNNFSQGWETIIGEKGTTISGGQKQRIAISRALLKPSPIIILDDAFASVDTETEAKILTAITQKCKEQSLILISHRVSTLKECNHIIVIDEGSIVEAGTHSQLLKQNGIYQEIALFQKAGGGDQL